MPPKKPSELYSVSKTTFWFAIVSIVLTGCLVAMILQDYTREWKIYQKKFIQLKTEKLKKQLQETNAAIDQKKLSELTKQYEEAHNELKARQADTQKLLHERDMLDVEITKVRGKVQDLKQTYDADRYLFEEHAHKKDKESAEYQKRLDSLKPQMDALTLRLEDLEHQRDEKENHLRAFSAKETEIQKEINTLLTQKTRLEKAISATQPTLAKDILNAPMIDFLSPSLRIQQVVLEDLYDDYHFTKVQKVDRCTTCHLAIDQKGFEEAPQPFRTHPNLDLYLSAASPHPIEKMGCTTCHGGSGQSVSFTDSAHTPHSEEQKKEWQKKYHWRPLEKWEQTMLPLPHVQAACAKCHQGVVNIPQADQLNKGRNLARTYGCFACHTIKGFENSWKVGPDLTHLQSKVDREWIIRWLNDPKAFRPTTKMPQIFHLENISSESDKEKSNASIEAVTEYLLGHSEPVDLTTPPVSKDPAAGEKLVKEIGCLGCHSLSGVQGSTFGPPLTNLGSKVSATWLTTWLKDPKHYSKDTRMPNLRLSDQEAADIASTLLSERNETFEHQPLATVKPEVRDDMVLFELQKTMRRVDAEEKLKNMPEKERRVFLGKQTISTQGCFGCHTIKGFEEAKPIGTELTKEGQKDIHQFDFGFVPMEHTRENWFFQKLKSPRSFDEGRIKEYHEKLRMPQFNFTDEEAQAITTFLLSLREEPIPLEMTRQLTDADKAVEKGRLLITKLNCQGCHTLDGKEGTLRSLYEDLGNAPPVIDGEGSKVQEKWLHEFLKTPSPIRPWLKVRMPAFGFNDEKANDLVHYFAYLAHQQVSYQGYPAPNTSPQKLQAGKTLFEAFQCVKCHQVNAASAAMGSSFLAPDLSIAKERLKPDWVTQWLEDPQQVQPGTMMPSFFPEGQTPMPDLLNGDVHQQIEVIRDYLLQYEPEKEEKKP